jgi:hypothetical protein
MRDSIGADLFEFLEALNIEARENVKPMIKKVRLKFCRRNVMS